MVSRLDRLFILLDTGSTESIRLAAAKQLGEVQRVQPSELDYLLRRIKEYSGKSVWETRVAAGHATRCILENVEQWPNPCKEEGFTNDGDNKIECQRDIADRLIKQSVSTTQVIEQFDLDEIIAQCPKLLSLDVAETNDNELVSQSTSKTTPFKNRSRSNQTSKLRKADKEQLNRQRNLINKELGISMVTQLNCGVNSTDIVTNDDLQTEYDTLDNIAKANKVKGQQDSRHILKRNLTNYDKIIDLLVQENCITKPSSLLKVKPEDESLTTPEMVIVVAPDDRWPLTDIAIQYSEDLFNPSWEIRHGAAIALREIVKLQGNSAGRRADLKASSNDLLNQLWLVDMALKAVCVLALDKFGDFLFDQVVAPVRENTAQILGCCVAHMTEENACSIVNLMLKLLQNQNWETRHGAMLGLKYSLNVVDEPLSRKILQTCFEPIVNCLKDPVDDVSAEAAASLVPIKDLMVETNPNRAPTLIKFLWEHLADLDELTTSTSNIVLLLASLITSSTTKLETLELSKSIPKLWSLLGHSSTTVRVSVFRALITLIKTQSSTCLHWMPDVLISDALRLVFQRAILENMEEVRPDIEDVWMHLIKIDTDPTRNHLERFQLLKSTSQYLNYWLCLTMQPSNVPIDRSSPMWLNMTPESAEGGLYIGSCTFNAETAAQQKLQVTKCRLLSTKLLGALYANLVNIVDDSPDSTESQHAKETLYYLEVMFIHYMQTKSANQRTISGWTIESWAVEQAKLLHHNYDKLRATLPVPLVDLLNQVLQESTICYDESASAFTRLQQETRDFVASLKSADINYPLVGSSNNDKRTIYNLNQIQILCDLNLEEELLRITSKKQTDKSSVEHDIRKSDKFITLSSKKANIAKTLKFTTACQKSLNTSVLSSMSCALISWHLMPQNTKLVAGPLLESIELEEELVLQDKSIVYLVTLFDIMCQSAELHKDLINCMLQRLVDILSAKVLGLAIAEENDIKKLETDIHRIVLLDNLQRKAELSRHVGRRQSTLNSSFSLKRSHSLTTTLELDNDSAIQSDDQRNQQNTISKQDDFKVRGASVALGKLVQHFSDKLPERLPQLWKMVTSDIKDNIEAHCADSSSFDTEKQLVRCLRILEVIGEKLDSKLQKNLLDLFPDLIRLLTSKKPNVRHSSSQCIGLVSKLMFDDTIDMIADKILPMLQEGNSTLARCGSIEAIALIIEYLQLNLVHQINMFIIHVLRRMSDQNDQVRLMATHCFGKLLSLMPLNLEKTRGTQQNDSKTAAPIKGKHDDQRFIEQLLDPKKLDNFEIPFKVNAELRSYQQDGLNWLAFLNRFNLHGILCDEMGLGKTLMTICIVASDHYKLSSFEPSLIVCPSTLIEHWFYEIHKFLPKKPNILKPVRYSGNLSDRTALRCILMDSINSAKSGSTSKDHYNLIVASYDIVRNDIDFFKGVQWNYCVLDEGHIIKNGKTKLSRAIRLLNANHRLILSGTPIQNNVTELWSLFDYLMPGFLGSDRQFNSRYAKPILQSREPKCSPRELEAGALAMESLHRQVLPFILRRLKDDVLDDLPPKIIQDYYCELSWLQQKLYEDFARSKLCKNVTRKSIDDINGPCDTNSTTKTSSKNHVFQALQYLKNVCNHPKLVLTPKHPEYQEIKRTLDQDKSSLDDIGHSSKLKALKQLLSDCGIGAVANQVGDESQQSLALESVVNQHRALVFCQVRSMVDIIENDLLKRHQPSITYLKLDGSIPPKQRHSIVSRFNNDPSIDVLLLTTQIGGLGLNLTGADTVIFVEHDWNPTKDLQAMDRAHRIGQKKVVNVYRLITKGTLEEKIMGLQKFKIMVSNTVINQDNAGLATMDVDQLFDLFEVTGGSTQQDDNKDGRKQSDGKGKVSIMDMLPNLWDQQQYETEYDLSSFVSSLKN